MRAVVLRLTSLPHRLVHHDRAGDRYIERRNLPCHGNPQQVIAGLFDQIVQSCAFAPEDEDAVGLEVEVGVVGSSAFIQSEDPDVLLLHLFERANEVGNPRNPNVFRGSGRGFGYGRGDGGGSALGEDDAVDAGTVGGSEQRSEVVGVFDAVEGEEEAVLARLFGVRESLRFRGIFALERRRGRPDGHRCGRAG